MTTIVLNQNLESKEWNIPSSSFSKKYEKIKEKNNQERATQLENEKKYGASEFSPPLKEEMFDLLLASPDKTLNYEQCDNHFINAVLLAYNNHTGLRLTPDDLLSVIALNVSQTVNKHSEEMRKLFVDHDEKKKLTVIYNGTTTKDNSKLWEYFMTEMSKLVDTETKTAFELKADFSTSTPTTRFVTNAIQLSTFKEYFSYGFMCMCGIPKVHLEGTLDDWNQLQAHYTHVKRVFQDNGFFYLDNWFNAMDVLINLFVDMRALGEGEVEATQEMKDLWSRVVTYVPYGSGGQKYLSGWIQLLFAGDKDFPKNSNILNMETLPPEKSGNCYSWQDQFKDWAQVCRKNNTVPPGISQFQGEFNYYGEITKVNMNAGFVGATYSKEKNEVSPLLGYFLTQSEECEPEHFAV